MRVSRFQIETFIREKLIVRLLKMNDNSHKEVLRILAFENSNGIAFWPPKIQRAERQLQVGRSAAMLFTRGFFDEDAHLP